MDNEILLTGMVLRDMPIGEYDKRVSLLTLERGRISAFLRGAKRGKGSPLGGVGPFTFGKFYVYEGRGSYTVKRVEIEERFESVQNDLTNIAYGAYFLDVAEYYSRENADENDRMKLLFQSLRALESEKFTPEFIRLIYELKNIAINGEYPNIFNCASCDTKDDLKYFSFDKRVVFCKDCGDNVPGKVQLSQAVLYALWFIFTTPTNKLYSFKLSEGSFSELRRFTDRYMNLYFKHPFKTLDMIRVLAE